MNQKSALIILIWFRLTKWRKDLSVCCFLRLEYNMLIIGTGSHQSHAVPCVNAGGNWLFDLIPSPTLEFAKSIIKVDSADGLKLMFKLRKFHPLSKWLASLGIMADQLMAPLEHLKMIVFWRSQEFQGDNWAPMMPRDASLYIYLIAVAFADRVWNWWQIVITCMRR